MHCIRVILVDDHPAVRVGLEGVLNKFDDITVVGTAGSGTAAIALCTQTAPDVALVDLAMPDMDGIATTQAIKGHCPDVQVLILTQSGSEEDIGRALRAGAMGYLLKTAEIKEIADGIRSAAQGRRVLSQQVIEAMIRVSTAQKPHPDSNLTPREYDVLVLLVQGLKNPQIAEELVVSVSTVKFHVGTILKKLGVQNRTQAVLAALDRQLVQNPSKP